MRPSLNGGSRPRVGYVTGRSDFEHPSDRRRFAWYLRRRGLVPVVARPDDSYDVYYMSRSTDLTYWVEHLRQVRARDAGARVLCDMSDAYLAVPALDWRNAGRGVVHYLLGRAHRPALSYRQLLLDAIAVSDCVICGSPEQRDLLLQHHPNVHVTTDYFGSDAPARKQDYARRPGELHVAWEGLSHGNEPIFRQLRAVLEPFAATTRVFVHVITDPRYCRYGGRIGCTETSRLLARVFSGSGIRPMYYAWNSRTFAAIASSCDVALLPIPREDVLMWMKPENKLLLLWTLGLPVIASATPAYARVMRQAGLPDACATDDDWRRSIERLLDSEQARAEHVDAASRLLAAEYSEQALLQRWDAALASIDRPLAGHSSVQPTQLMEVES